MALLLVGSLLNWSAPAQVLGLDSDRRACVFPDNAQADAPMEVQIELLGCPHPDRPVHVVVRVRVDRPVEDVRVRIGGTLHVVQGPSTFNGSLHPGTTPVLDVTLAGVDGPQERLVAVASGTVLRDTTYVQESTSDHLVIDLGDRCTVVYRGAFPAEASGCRS